MTDQFGTVVTAQADWSAVTLKQLIQNANDITGGDAATKPNIESLAGELIDRLQALERSPILGLAKNKS